MSTTKKNTTRRDSAGGSLLLAVLASPLGWLADDRPVALRDRRPHGDDADSLGAQMSALLWSITLLVLAALAPTWWAAPAVAGVLLLVLPTRTAAGRGGELVVPTEDRGARGRLAVTAWALGLMPAASYAAVDRRDRDPEGVRGRRRRRLRALLGVVLPTALLGLDAHLHGALSAQLAPIWGTTMDLPGSLSLPLDAGLLGRLALVLMVIATLSGSTAPLGRYHSEDLTLTGSERHTGLAGPLAAALGVSVRDFDLDSELHWNAAGADSDRGRRSKRARSQGFHARTISGPVAVALLDPARRERLGHIFPEWELTEWSHRDFRLAPVSDAERARRSNLQDLEGLVESVTGDGEDGAEIGEPVTLDTSDVEWEED